jgi:hypothetical protein
LLIVAAIAAALNITQLGEFLLPVTQDVGLNITQVTGFTDGKVAPAWYLRKKPSWLLVLYRFQRVPSVFGPA